MTIESFNSSLLIIACYFKKLKIAMNTQITRDRVFRRPSFVGDIIITIFHFRKRRFSLSKKYLFEFFSFTSGFTRILLRRQEEGDLKLEKRTMEFNDLVASNKQSFPRGEGGGR